MRRNSRDLTEVIEFDDNRTANGYGVQDRSLCDAKRLKDTLKPIFFSMRLFGIVYGDIFQACCSKNNKVLPSAKNGDYDLERQEVKYINRSERCRYILGLTYSILVAMIIFTCCAHGFYEVCMSTNIMDIMTRVFLLLWIILCALQHVICLVITSHRTKRCPLNRFDKFVKAIMMVRAASVTKSKKCVLKTVLAGWGYIIVNALVVYSGTHNPHEETRESIRIVFNGKSNWTKTNNDPITYFYSAALPVLCGTWTMPTCFYIALCMVVTGFFDDIYERASHSILKKKTVKLEELRTEYVRLCNVLSALNDLLSPLGMLMFSVYIPLICLNINVCIQTFDHDSIINRIAYIFWITGNVAILVVVSVSGAQVNNSACRLCEILYNINAQELDKKSELELILLLSNLNTNYTGLTVGGLVTISKEMILTIFGTIVGYLTILIQFK